MISQMTADCLRPPQATKVDRSLRVPRPLEHAAGPGEQRKDVARSNEVGWPGVGVHGEQDRLRAIGSRYPGRDVVSRLDRDTERGAAARVVGAFIDHQRYLEFRETLLVRRHADQPAPVRGHEIHDLWGHEFRRADEIAFVFAVLVVQDDDHLPVSQIVDDVFDLGERVLVTRGFRVFSHQALLSGSGVQAASQDSAPGDRLPS